MAFRPPEGKQFASASGDGSIILWEPDAESRKYRFLKGHRGAVRRLAYSGSGRHLETYNALTGELLYSFDYNEDGSFSSLTDFDGNTVTLERDSGGHPSALVGPFGDRTVLTTNADGYVTAVTSPGGRVTRMSYSAEGLLETVTDPNSNPSTLEYSPDGLLIRTQDPAGGGVTMSRQVLEDGFETTFTTSMGRVIAAAAVVDDARLRTSLLGVPGVLGQLQVRHRAAVGATLLGLTQIHVPKRRHSRPRKTRPPSRSVYLGSWRRMVRPQPDRSTTYATSTRQIPGCVPRNCQSRV